MFLSFLDIFDLLNPNPNDASAISAHMLTVFLDLGEKMHFLLKKKTKQNKTKKKTYFFSPSFKDFTHFSLLIHIDNNFLIKISGDSTIYCGLHICLVKNVSFSTFG